MAADVRAAEEANYFYTKAGDIFSLSSSLILDFVKEKASNLGLLMY